MRLFTALLFTPMSTSPISTRRRPGRDTESTTGRDDTHNVLATEPGLGGSRFKSGSGQFCPFFARGQCRYGDQCRWRHDAVAAIATAVSRSNSASLAASNAKVCTFHFEQSNRELKNRRSRPRAKVKYSSKLNRVLRGGRVLAQKETNADIAMTPQRPYEAILCHNLLRI